MPMPHRTQLQLIKRRLVGTEGAERIKVLRAALEELPGYRSGPYADIRKWINDQLQETRVRARTVHRDSIAVVREGAAQVALVGPPNAGKSSLLHALSDIQIRTGDYTFTTLRPVAAITRIHDVLIQLVEIPGLIEGAAGGRGGGRALLGVLRGADAIVYCHDAAQPESLTAVRGEVEAAGIDKPSVVAMTKADELAEFPRSPDHAVAVSILDDQTLGDLREAIWNLTGLIRVWTRRPGSSEADALALRKGATARDVAAALHKNLAEQFQGARIWGPSARFEGQRVGADHPMADDDVIEILPAR